jgi:hypothetical protein
MRDNVDVWPQPLWTRSRPHEERTLPSPLPAPSAWPVRAIVSLGLLAAFIGFVLILALVVAPSAGAAGGCGGA